MHLILGAWQSRRRFPSVLAASRVCQSVIAGFHREAPLLSIQDYPSPLPIP